MRGRVVDLSADSLTMSPSGSGRPIALAWSDVQGVQTAQPDRAASALLSGLTGAGLMALLPTASGASKGLAVSVAGVTGALLGAVAPYVMHWRPVALRG